MRHILRPKSGFTLIEIVVLMPMVILLIGAMITVIMNLSVSSLRTQERSKIQLEVLSALDRMEQDVKNSTFLISASFYGSTNLRMTLLATDKDPMDPSRRLIVASGCAVASSGLLPEEALTYDVAYRIVSNRLERQVILSGCGATSSNVWQKVGTEVLISDSSISLYVEYPQIGELIATATKVRLIASRDVGGRQISFTGRMFTRSPNIEEYY